MKIVSENIRKSLVQMNRTILKLRRKSHKSWNIRTNTSTNTKTKTKTKTNTNANTNNSISNADTFPTDNNYSTSVKFSRNPSTSRQNYSKP